MSEVPVAAGASGRKERTRAQYKKGQKCIVPIIEVDKETGEEKTVMYEAVVMRGEKRVREDSDEPVYMYLVHYKGFGKQHDSWLEEDILVKFDHDVLSGKSSAAADQARRRAQETADAARKQAALQDIPVQLRLRVPPLLKKVVLDDHVQVTQHGRALPLPRSAHARPTVAETLQEWRGTAADDDAAAAAAAAEGDASGSSGEASGQELDEVVAGLLSYFEYALRQFLLYHPEVPLCDEALAGGAAPSEVYGAEHLVRLLVKLPELVPVVMMAGQGDARNVVAVEARLHHLMAFMTQAQAKLFSSAEEYKPNPHWAPPPLAAVPHLAAPAAPSAPAAAAAAAAAAAPAPEPEAVPAQ